LRRLSDSEREDSEQGTIVAQLSDFKIDSRHVLKLHDDRTTIRSPRNAFDLSASAGRELLCFLLGADGADIPDIPFRSFGLRPTQGESKMKRLLKMTAAPMTALFALAFVGITTPAAAAKYEYCRQDVTSGMRSCSFETMEQCQAMSSGRGGHCYRDPFLTDTSNAYAYQPKHVRSKKPAGNQ
jgi:hypothetical protein